MGRAHRARRRTALDHALHHRGDLIGGHRVDGLIAVGDDPGRGAGPQGGDFAIDTGALIVAIDRLAPAVLHPVHQRRLQPLAAVGEHRIGRHHLVKRGFLRPERVGEISAEVVIDAEVLGIFRHRIHADFLRKPDGHQVARALDAGAERRRAIELVRIVLRAPDALRRVDLDRRVDDDRRGRIA